MRLILVESPTKSKTISKFLGPDFKVLSSYGHVRDLPEDHLGIDTKKNFEPTYVIIPKAKKNILSLKKEVGKAELVILATDVDREGESIAWHLIQALKLKNKKPYQRIAFHEITESAIKQALKNPREIDLNLVNAQQARRILDRIVGYKLSPFLWKKVVRGLSAGRVQSVTVRLVAEREQEIQSFVPQEYWSIEVELQQRNKGSKDIFIAKLYKKEGKVIPKLGIKTKEEAEKIKKGLKKAEYIVSNVEKKETKRNPLPPFTTSTLQQESWKRLRLPAKRTMRIAQHLYERGLITYHRTDSLNLSQLSLLAAKKFIIEDFGKNYWAGYFRKFKTKGRVQEAHEAIRPTHPKKILSSLIKDSKNKGRFNGQDLQLYELIWKRFMASQMAPAIFDSVKIDIEAKNYLFRASGQTLKFDGFLRVYPLKFEEVELPLLTKNEVLELIKLIPSQHFTQPPSRYSEATLIKALEENGIGRPSTYAPTISTIQERHYIEKDDSKRFFPTEIGVVVNNILVKHFPNIVDVSFTAEMEEDLDKIASGKREWVSVIKEFYGPFKKKLKLKELEVPGKKSTYEKTSKKCPKCKGDIIIRLGRYGKFYACSNYPKCKHTEPLKKDTLGMNCFKCKKGEILVKRTKKGKIFYGCSNWPDCDFASWDKLHTAMVKNKPVIEKCPKCNSFLIETKRKQIKCSNKECNYRKWVKLTTK